MFSLKQELERSSDNSDHVVKKYLEECKKVIQELQCVYEVIFAWLLQGAIIPGEPQVTSTGVIEGGKDDYSKYVQDQDDVLPVKITHSKDNLQAKGIAADTHP